MFKERIRMAREWVSDLKARTAEYRKFKTYFPQSEINGVLTQPGDRLDPFEIGLIMMDKDSIMRQKLEKGEELTRYEQKMVREAGWLKAIDGSYTMEAAEEGFKVTVSIDTPEASSYLLSNVADMGAFLSYKEGKYERYPGTANIRAENESLVCAFPQVRGMPDKIQGLHVYTRPLDRRRMDERFVRLSFSLKP